MQTTIIYQVSWEKCIQHSSMSIVLIACAFGQPIRNPLKQLRVRQGIEITTYLNSMESGSSSMAERLCADEEVIGSSPVSRSKEDRGIL